MCPTDPGEADGGPLLVHATAIAAGGRAVLIRGPSGSGKSDLALRCLVHPVSELVPAAAKLVSDDQVWLGRRGRRLVAWAPVEIRGRIEVRGLGILNVPAATAAGETEVVLAVLLVSSGQVERLPGPLPEAEFLGVRVPEVAIAAREASAPVKLLLALGRCAAVP